MLVIRRGGQSAVRHALVGEAVHMLVPPRTEATATNGRKITVGRITTPRDRSLFGEGSSPPRMQIFLNEAVLPADVLESRADKGCPRMWFDLLNLCDRYGNNDWTYRVQIEEIGQRKD